MEVLGVFSTTEQAAAAVDRLLAAGIAEDRVTSLTSVPYPNGVLVRQQDRSRFYWMALAGGLFGACAGFALAIGTAWLYPLQTGDKPIIAFFPAGIITYEFAMLFAIVGALLGMLLEMGLPALRKRLYDPEIGDGLIGICVELDEGESATRAAELLQQAGAVRVHEDKEER